MVSRDAKWSDEVDGAPGRAVAVALAFVSAALLFVLQPHMGRRLAPTVGGGPAVWNACLVFFQSALLAGCGYSLLLLRRAPHRAAAIHATALVAACVWLFVGATLSWEALDASPTLRTLLTLVALVGMPVAVLSATTPLLHRWAGGYGIYAASNAGCLLALLLYPFAIEPNVGLNAQWICWRWGFVAFAATMVVGIRYVGTNPFAERKATIVSPSETPTSRWRWLLWSALPSALLVSTTQKITEDVAGGPLLWIPPLALFLLASILAFAGRSPSMLAFAWLIPPLLLVRGALLAVTAFAPSLWIQLAVELGVLFVAALCAFAALYALRPPDDQAGEFYLWLAVGGALGGSLASLVSPHLFRSGAEHPLALILLCLFLPNAKAPRTRAWIAIVMLIGTAAFVLFNRERGGEAAALEGVLFAGSFGMLIAAAFGRPSAFGLLVGLPFASLGATFHRGVVHAERSEFGVHRVVENRDSDDVAYHALRHGGVIHGSQCREFGRMNEPLGYYHRQSAVGEALAWRMGSSTGGCVAVVGLGVGAALVHRRPDQRFVFFEIDPAVARIASDVRLFTYVSDAKENADVRIGDGRLSLSRTPDGSFETIFLDAFSGDAVPTHLLTKEAFATYLRKLKSRGAIVVNITNWFVDLEAVVAKVGEEVGLACVGKNQTADRNETTPNFAATRCLVLTRNEDSLNELIVKHGWRRIRPTPNAPLWTDDFCDLWSVVRWH